jgi:hypothetical protein
MKLRVIASFSLSTAVAFGASINSQSFNSLTWAGTSATGYTEYSVDAVGADALDFVNVVDSSGNWLVQNLPLFTTGLFSMVIGGFTGQPIDTFETAIPLVSAPSFASSSPHSTGSATYMADDPSGKEGAGTFTDPGAAPAPASVVFANNAILGFVYHLGVPDLAQGRNECGPTSAANSLSWLNNTYNLGLTQTTAQIRDVLKDGTHMKTNPATGTSDPNFIAGKNQYVIDKTLPIETHVIGSIGRTPDPQAVFIELAKGQDVELSVVWTGGGGHWVTLVGMIQIDGAYGIWYNDPDDGKTQTNFSWLTNSNSRVAGFGSANRIDTTVAESVPEPSPRLLIAVALFYLLHLRMQNRNAKRSIVSDHAGHPR